MVDSGWISGDSTVEFYAECPLCGEVALWRQTEDELEMVHEEGNC